MIPPRLHALCSVHFAWSDLIECGETWERFAAEGRALDNRPRAEESYAALAALAREVLPPV